MLKLAIGVIATVFGIMLFGMVDDVESIWYQVKFVEEEITKDYVKVHINLSDFTNRCEWNNRGSNYGIVLENHDVVVLHNDLDESVVIERLWNKYHKGVNSGGYMINSVLNVNQTTTFDMFYTNEYLVFYYGNETDKINGHDSICPRNTFLVLNWVYANEYELKSNIDTLKTDKDKLEDLFGLRGMVFFADKSLQDLMTV